MQKILRFLFAFFAILLSNCSQRQTNQVQKMNPNNINQIDPNNLDTIVLGGGCFWCLDAVYRRVPGVVGVVAGYSNGKIGNVTYREVCSGLTGAVEVVKIMFDNTKTDLSEILEIFWHVHNPTTLNQQGNDLGTQYRSGIYYKNLEQKEAAIKSMKEAEESGLWPGKYVTEILPLEKYSDAEDYHQNYFENNPNQPYCIYVVGEKVKKYEEMKK
jgi:peptide-methionine (S)-S-oxide reductase